MPKNIAAFFDFDNTLLAGDSGKIGFKYMWKEGYASTPFVLKLLFYNQLFKRHRITTERMAHLCLEFYKGQEYQMFLDGADEYYEELIRPRISPNISARLEDHRKQGHLIVILSALVCYLLEPVKKDLGIDCVRCTKLEVGPGGILTGRADGPVCEGEQKAVEARKLAEERDLDLSRSFAYGDHLSDLPMLEAVGHPFLVEPDPVVTAIARRRGWPILTHRAE